MSVERVTSNADQVELLLSFPNLPDRPCQLWDGLLSPPLSPKMGSETSKSVVHDSSIKNQYSDNDNDGRNNPFLSWDHPSKTGYSPYLTENSLTLFHLAYLEYGISMQHAGLI
jgi:hypothetical protein